MAAKASMRAKDVVQSDVLFSFWERLHAYAQENSRTLIAAAAAVAVLAGGLWLWWYQHARTEQETLNRFYAALQTLAQDGRNAEVPRDVAAQKALEQFTGLVQDHPGTLAGRCALFYAGSCAYAMGSHEQAIEFFQDFLEKGGGSVSYLVPFAHEGMGYTYEALGAYDEAITCFRKQQETGDGGTASMALLNLARCFEAAGDQAAACDHYRRFTEQRPGSALTDLATTKTAQLCASS